MDRKLRCVNKLSLISVAYKPTLSLACLCTEVSQQGRSFRKANWGNCLMWQGLSPRKLVLPKTHISFLKAAVAVDSVQGCCYLRIIQAEGLCAMQKFICMCFKANKNHLNMRNKKIGGKLFPVVLKMLFRTLAAAAAAATICSCRCMVCVVFLASCSTVHHSEHRG